MKQQSIRSDYSDSFITEELSIYLDALRFIAALAVLIGHLDQDGLYASWLWIGAFAHESVVVFFVLSGLVITHSTFKLECDWRSYTVARFARIYSVVLPAIALSFFVKSIAVWFDPVNLAPQFLAEDLRPTTFVGALLFLNESWQIGTSLPWNGPFWSLCYEVWYYVIFGLAIFVRGRSHWILVAAAALIAGPSILALFPLWLLGSWLANNGSKFIQPFWPSLLVWILSILAIVALNQSAIDVQIRHHLHDNIPGFWRLESSQRFFSDYLIGLLVAANFVAFRGLGKTINDWMASVKPAITFLAGYTFSLYLYHRPMTHFTGYFFPNADRSKTTTIIWLLLIVGLCFLLGSVTEQKKQIFRSWAKRIVRTT